MITKAIVEKGVGGKFPVGLEYSSPDLEAGHTITAVETTVSPTGLTLGTPTIDVVNHIVEVLVSNGTAGITYTVQFKVTTSAGNIYKHPHRDIVKVKVK